VPKLPGIIISVLSELWKKPVFKIVHQGKHIVMSDGSRILTIPRHNPVNEYTMGGIVRDAGLTVEKFRSSYSNEAS
jgi:hypothetical protein